MPENGKSPTPGPIQQRNSDPAERVQRWIYIALQASMAVAIVIAIYERQWLTTAVVFAIMLMMFVPVFLEGRFHIDIPAEFETLAVVFAYAALFLGEVRGYYGRFWWWDIALHTTSGLLLGILGFLLVYVLNETRRVDMHLRPFFVSLFAFVFAVAMGALWEIFEFSMDQLIGTQMQKPMLGDPSGLTDTMWDLIVDTIGAFVISALGYWHMRQRTHSFVDLWIQKFIERNPRLFRTLH